MRREWVLLLSLLLIGCATVAPQHDLSSRKSAIPHYGLVGHPSVRAPVRPIQFSPGTVRINNFPTTASTSAISIRCVNTAGSAFETCGGAGGGGTSSTFGAAFPATGTAAGFSDGTNMQAARLFDLDTGAGLEYGLGINLRFMASGGSVEAGTATNPLRIDPTGTTIQPISGTITANAGTNLNTSALALDATLTNRFPAGSTPADNESNSITATRLGIYNYIFDGTTWDRWTGAVSGTVTANQGTPTNWAINIAQVGAIAVVGGACETEQPIYVQINQTTGTQLITGTASERIYICSLQVVTATAQNVALVDGTVTVCGTGTVGMLGGSTAATGWNFAANTGIVLPQNTHGWTKTSTDADNVCLLQSGAGQVSGSLSYVSRANL